MGTSECDTIMLFLCQRHSPTVEGLEPKID